MRRNLLLIFIFTVFISQGADIEKDNCITISDSIPQIDNPITNSEVQKIESQDSIILTKKDTIVKKNLYQKVISYFSDANKPKSNKRFDVSFIGGPHYATDTKLGLGLAGAGIYRMDQNDTISQPSNVSLIGDLSTVGFYLVGVRGNNIFPKDRYRLNYNLYLYSFPSYYWGIGYENGNNNDNKTKLKRFQSKIKIELLAKLARNLYFGPMLVWDYVKGEDLERLDLLDGMPLCTRNYGFGLTLEYDSRDLITNASKGIHLYVNQTFRPDWLWNEYAFSTTDFRFRYYQKAWKGAIIAGEFKALFNFGDPSWAMMANLGDSNSMRGYYEGRYRDKDMMAAQIELRQHIWRRNGLVLWAGMGTVFHSFNTIGPMLPNYGIGYRWEFKKRVNVRLDYGFGKSGQSGFIFQINEAF